MLPKFRSGCGVGLLVVATIVGCKDKDSRPKPNPPAPVAAKPEPKPDPPHFAAPGISAQLFIVLRANVVSV